MEALNTVEKGEVEENTQTAIEMELKQLHQRILQHAGGCRVTSSVNAFGVSCV